MGRQVSPPVRNYRYFAG